jgi:glycosyltransferase involved in cell wall biosynthesis
MMKFTIMHWAPQSGTQTGTGKAIDTWAEATAATGASVTVVGHNLSAFENSPSIVSHIGGTESIRKLLKIFRKGIKNVNIVHLHGAFDPILSVVLLIAGIEKIRRFFNGTRLIVVLTPHGALSDFVFKKNRFRKAMYWHFIDKWVMKLIDEFIVNTPIECEQLKKRYQTARCSTIPLVIDQLFSENASGMQINRHSDGIPILCTIGRYDIIIKGLDILVKAVKQLNENGQNVLMRCVGYDKQGGIDELQHFIDTEHAGPYIECTGPKFGEEKVELLKSSTLFCMPSRYESFSYSLMEGLQSGLPVLVGSGACVASYLNNEQREMLVVEPSVDAWVSAIRRTLATPTISREHTESAFKFFSRICNPTRVGQSLCQVYSRLLHQK